MFGQIRRWARTNPYFRKLFGYYLASSGLFDAYFRNYALPGHLKKRLSVILSSPDNERIPKVPGAGEIRGGRQIMHNGLRIYLGSYYGPEFSVILKESRGIHEPQEERVFGEVLPAMPANAVMIEMGAFWSFYSMWFQQKVPGAVNYMIEPDAFNLGHGKRNFRLNKMKGEFVQAFIGQSSAKGPEGNMICVDDFARERNIPFIHMLHSDIQGFEHDMLLGAEECFAAKKIGYVFISTHSNDLHTKCLQFLRERDFIILASANIDESFSEDGLIAARAPYFPGIGPVAISKRNKTA